MLAWTHCLYPQLLVRQRENCTYKLGATQAPQQHQRDHWLLHKTSCYMRKSQCHIHRKFFSLCHNIQNRCHGHHPSPLFLNWRGCCGSIGQLNTRAECFPTFRAEFVATNQDPNHWYIHHQWCQHQHHSKQTSNHRYGVPTLLPTRPQPPFTQPPPYDRPTSTENYSCTDHSSRRRPRAITHEIYPVRSSPIQNSQTPARYSAGSPRGSQPSPFKARVNPFTLTQGVLHRAPWRNFKFHQFTNPVGTNTGCSRSRKDKLPGHTTSPHHLIVHWN